MSVYNVSGEDVDMNAILKMCPDLPASDRSQFVAQRLLSILTNSVPRIKMNY